MCDKIKTQHTDNPSRIITSGCNTAVEHLSIFVEKVLYGIASYLSSRIKDTNHILDNTDDLNISNLRPEPVVIKFLDEQVCKDPPTQCVELC